MALRVCVYTAICGGYDDLKPQPPQTIPCDFICFTDGSVDTPVTPWRIAHLEQDSTKTSSRFQAKFPKILPHKVFEGLDKERGLGRSEPYDITVWIDASVQILRPNCVEQLIDHLGESGMAAIVHPERDCIFDESKAALKRATVQKHVGMPVREQVEYYRSQGYPEHHGLLAGNVIVRDMHNERVRQINEAWWTEILRWSVRDQLSLPYVLWSLNAPCSVIDVNLWRNHLFEVWPHLDDSALRARGEYLAVPFAGREDGAKIAMYVPESGQWIFPDDSTEARAFLFGSPGKNYVPLMGDWDGDGCDSPGLYDPDTGTFFLRNQCTHGPADYVFSFGPPGAFPVIGDWDGDGRDTVGVFNPEAGSWALTNRHQPGSADAEFHFGAPGTSMLPIAGDWDGRGRDGVGLYDSTYSSWFLTSELKSSKAEQFDFGPSRGVPVVGDWDGDGIDEVGVFTQEDGQAFLARSNRKASPCWRAVLDPIGARPVAGRFRAVKGTGSKKPVRVTDERGYSNHAVLRNKSPAGITERILAEDLSWAPDHLARYAFAAHWVAGRRVLDLCCGVGYGSNLLSAAGARKVFGVDISREAIDYAKRMYKSDGVEFICDDASHVPPFSMIDVVTCFEGLEHVQEPEKTLATIANSLAPDGIALISSPNGAYYPGGFSGNPYHVKEYTRDQFASLLEQFFGSVEMYFQWYHGDPRRPVFTNGMGREDETEKAFRLRPLPFSILTEKDSPVEEPLIWVALCRNPRGVAQRTLRD